MQNHTLSESIQTSSYVYIIGVAGDSGSGKSTFSNAIVSIFGKELVSTITLDDYHIYDRDERAQRGITPLDPKANDLHRLADDIRALKKGDAILKPVYSHDRGTIEQPVLFHPTRFVILEGLHPFATPELFAQLDYTLFVDPDTDVKHDWKIRRDVQSRNYSSGQVIGEISKRESDYRDYVFPQRARAGTIIQIGYSGYGKEKGDLRNMYRVTLAMKPPETCLEDIELNIDLCSLFTRSSHDFLLECRTLELDGRQLRSLTADGELNHETIHKIERNIEEQTGVHPIDLFTGKENITGTDLARLIISWQIINHRILIDIRNHNQPE